MGARLWPPCKSVRMQLACLAGQGGDKGWSLDHPGLDSWLSQPVPCSPHIVSTAQTGKLRPREGQMARVASLRTLPSQARDVLIPRELGLSMVLPGLDDGLSQLELIGGFKAPRHSPACPVSLQACKGHIPGA